MVLVNWTLSVLVQSKFLFLIKLLIIKWVKKHIVIRILLTELIRVIWLICNSLIISEPIKATYWVIDQTPYLWYGPVETRCRNKIIVWIMLIGYIDVLMRIFEVETFFSYMIWLLNSILEIFTVIYVHVLGLLFKFLNLLC